MTVPTAERVLGCILGGALGDALGGRHEGHPAAVDVRWGGAWRLSDDTQLTIATCEAMIEAGGPDPATIAATFVRWYRARRLTGLGAATLGAIRGLVAGGHWALVGRRGEMAAGNGAAMRIAPLAFWVDPLAPAGRRTIRDVRLTHHSEEAYAGALAIAIAVRLAFTGDWAGDATLLSRVEAALPDSRVRDRLREFAADEEPLAIAAAALKHGRSGYVVESVPLALLAAQAVARDGFTAVLDEVVGAGGDSDTNASLAGQIGGCLLGAKGLPLAHLEALPELTLLRATASRFTVVLASR